MRLWAGCWSGLRSSPVILFFWASSLVCFSTKGSFFRGSDESVFRAFVFVSLRRYVHDSKCNLLTVATSPKLGVTWIDSASFVIYASETWFCGDPTENANVGKVFKLCASVLSAKPACNCSQRFLKALSESTRAMSPGSKVLEWKQSSKWLHDSFQMTRCAKHKRKWVIRELMQTIKNT